MAMDAVVVTPEAWRRAAADERSGVVLTRRQLVREPLGGRTWRAALTNPTDRLWTDVTIELRFLDRNGRAVGGLGGRAERLAPGAGLNLQSRVPAGATGLRIESLGWAADGVRYERGAGQTWPLDRAPERAGRGEAWRA